MIYTLVLSTKEEIEISEKELNYFKENMSSNFIELENGIINPSFVVSILANEDSSRADNLQRLRLLKKEDLKPEDFSVIRNALTGHSLKGIKYISKLLDKYENKQLK